MDLDDPDGSACPRLAPSGGASFSPGGERRSSRPPAAPTAGAAGRPGRRAGRRRLRSGQGDGGPGSTPSPPTPGSAPTPISRAATGCSLWDFLYGLAIALAAPRHRPSPCACRNFAERITRFGFVHGPALRPAVRRGRRPSSACRSRLYEGYFPRAPVQDVQPHPGRLVRRGGQGGLVLGLIFGSLGDRGPSYSFLRRQAAHLVDLGKRCCRLPLTTLRHPRRPESGSSRCLTP